MTLVITDLAASIAALVVGPLAFRLAGGRRSVLAWIDGFVLVTVIGLVFFTMLPEAVIHGGWWVLILVVLGAAGPNLFERLGHAVGHPAHALTIAVALLGLGLHSLTDGGAIATGRMAAADGINLWGVGVALHRLPVGFTIWWLIRGRYGQRAAIGILSIIALGTVAGAAIGPAVAGASGGAVAWFQALVCGSLLHVVLHSPAVPHDPGAPAPARAGLGRYEGAGAIVGLVFLVVLVTEAADMGHGHLSGVAHPDYTAEIGAIFLGMALAGAPALALAYAIGGLARSWLADAPLEVTGREQSLAQAGYGVLRGLVLAIRCTGGIPRRGSPVIRGAPPAAALAFLAAAAALGLDAILISVPLLGGPMTLVRIAASLTLAVLVGTIAGMLVRTPLQTRPPQTEPRAWPRLQKFGTGIEEIAHRRVPWVVVGLGVAAVAAPLVRGGWLGSLPGWIDVPLLAMLGLPAYVSASAATPLAAVLLAGGASPGGATAFLLTSPVMNPATFGILASGHGRRIALGVGAGIFVLSVGAGLLVNVAWPAIGLTQLPAANLTTASPLQLISLALLALGVLQSILRRGARAFLGELKSHN